MHQESGKGAFTFRKQDIFIFIFIPLYVLNKWILSHRNCILDLNAIISNISKKQVINNELFYNDIMSFVRGQMIDMPTVKQARNVLRLIQ